MNLPFFKPKSRTPLREYLYALEINHGFVKSAIWTVVNGKPQVLSVGPAVPFSGRDEHELVTAADQTLSECTNRFDPTSRIQPEKVILGLPPDWVASEKITADKLKQLKALSQKLSLTAVGFVVIPESIVRYLQVTESSTASAILIGISPTQLELTLVKLGKNIGTEIVRRSNSVPADVTEGLSRFMHADMLPSRMLLYDTNQSLEPVRQDLLAYPWLAPQAKLPFLHFPKIEILPTDFSITSIAVAGGSEVAQAIGLIDEPHVPSSQTPQAELTPAEPIPTVTPEELGFSLTADPPHTHTPLVAVPSPRPQVTQHIEQIEEEEFTPSPQPSSPKRRLHPFSFSHSRLPFVVIGIVLLLVGLVTAYWYLPKATITLTLTPKPLEHQFDLLADTGISESNLDKPAIPAQMAEVTVSQSETVPATGSKLIGDKATGTVTLINGTSVSKKFASGTVLTGPNSLKFLTTSEVEVASASGSADPNSYQPGKADVSVSADAIGTDANLSAGTEFKVGTFSALDFTAKNSSAFSGGSSRTVKAISKDDYAALRSKVTTAAKDKAKEELMSKSTDTQLVVTESLTTSVVSEEFSHKVGDTADDVGLNLTVKATAITIDQADLSPIVNKLLTPKIPANYSLTGNPDYQFAIKSADKSTVNLNVTVKANLIPQLDNDQITQNVVGKSRDVARSYLESLPGISQIEIAYWPPLPSFLLGLPKQAKNITIDVTQ